MAHRQSSLERMLNAGCIVAALIHIAVLSSIMQESKPIIWPLHNDTIHRVGRGVDFFALYHAAVNMRNGISPYEMNDDGITPYYYPFRYLPIVGFAARVFTLLRPWQAYLVWILLLECILALFLYAIYRVLPQKRLWKAICMILLLSSPYFLEVYMGQFTFVAVALCFLSILLPRGGILYSLSVLLKVFPIITAPAFLISTRYRRHLITATILLLLTTLPFFYANRGDLHRFINSNFAPVRGFGSGNYGFMMLLHLFANSLDWAFLLNHSQKIFSVLRALILSATILFVLLAKKDIVLSASTLMLAHFVSYQHVWEHHMSAVVLIGVFLLTREGLSKKEITFLLFCVMVLALPTPYFFFDETKDPEIWDPAIWWPRYASYVILLSKVIPTLFLFGWCMLRLKPVRSEAKTPGTLAESS